MSNAHEMPPEQVAMWRAIDDLRERVETMETGVLNLQLACGGSELTDVVLNLGAVCLGSEHGDVANSLSDLRCALSNTGASVGGVQSPSERVAALESACGIKR